MANKAENILQTCWDLSAEIHSVKLSYLELLSIAIPRQQSNGGKTRTHTVAYTQYTRACTWVSLDNLKHTKEQDICRRRLWLATLSSSDRLDKKAKIIIDSRTLCGCGCGCHTLSSSPSSSSIITSNSAVQTSP